MSKKDSYEILCYNTDRSEIFGEASGVVFPKTVEEVKKAIFNNQNIVPRGLGTSIVGGCVPSNSLVVDMKQMNKINFDFKLKKVHTEAGITINELNEKLKAIGYEFPIYGEGTIGGMIAMNYPSFMGAYGNIKDWIEEIEFVNGKGELIKFTKSDIGEVCGMEGVTGIITSAKLRTIPYTEKSISVFQTSDVEEIFSMAKKFRSEKNISMIRIYSPYFSKVLGFPEKYHIFIIFNNNSGKIKGEEYKIIFRKLIKDYYNISRAGYKDTEDSQFLFERIKDFVLFLDKFNIPYSGDLHLRIIFSYFKDDLMKQEVIKLIQRMNCKPGKYGIGIKRKNLLENLQKKIIKRIKLRHDPYLKMNIGKVISIEEMETKSSNDESFSNSLTGTDDINNIADDKVEEVFDANVNLNDIRKNNESNDINFNINKNLINDIIFNKKSKEGFKK